MRPIWVGSSSPAISRLEDDDLTAVVDARSPAFLARHPALPRLYAVEETGSGSVGAFEIDGATLTPTATVGSGGSSPCHLFVHPAGGWVYTANYGDGVVSALALDGAGDPTGERVELPHTGSGPRADRQERAHAHSTWVSPGGGWLVAADLGTDELRAYRLEPDGRPQPTPSITALPPGTGPRHVAVDGDLLYVAGELSCEVLTVRWDETSGTGEVIGTVGVVTLPPRSGDENTLSHLEKVDEVLVVGVRGADSLAVVGLVDGVASTLVAEVLTVAWPRHLTVVDGVVLVAGERADLIGSHPIATGADGAMTVGELATTVAATAPMCLLPER